MGLMNYFRKLFWKHKKLSVLGAGTVALAMGVQQMLDKQEVEIKRDVVQQEVVLKKIKKEVLENPHKMKLVEKEKDARSELKKLKIVLKEISSEEEQVKIAIKRLEAEPLYEHGDDNSIYSIKKEIAKEKKILNMMKGLSKLTGDEYKMLQDYHNTLVEPNILPHKVLRKFPDEINQSDIDEFINLNGLFLNDYVFPAEFYNKSANHHLIELQLNIRASELEKKRLEDYFKINDTLVKLLISKGSQRRLRKYTDKMNRLNDDLAEYLLELDKYILSLKTTLDFMLKTA